MQILFSKNIIGKAATYATRNANFFTVKKPPFTEKIYSFAAFDFFQGLVRDTFAKH